MNPSHYTSCMSYLLHSPVLPQPPLQLARHNFGYTNSHTTTEIPACSPWRCSPLCAHPRDHRSLVFTTSNGLFMSAPRSPRPHTHTHTQRHNFGYTNAHTPPNCLSAYPGGDRRSVHARVAAAHLRLDRRQLQRWHLRV